MPRFELDPRIEAEGISRSKIAVEQRAIENAAKREYLEQRSWFIANVGGLLVPDSTGNAGPIKIGAILFSRSPGKLTPDSKLLRAELGDGAARFFKRGAPIYYVRDAANPDLEQ